MYFSGSAGGDHDAAPYDAHPNELTSIRAVAEAAAALGHRLEANDILDLGCGFGRQLGEVATTTRGWLVGVDASAVSCEAARGILAPWKDRVEIVHAEIADLMAQDLGRFDLIYCVGTLYAAPAETRSAILHAVRETLRPGGVAVFTYYAGTKGHIKAEVIRYLRALRDPGAPLGEALVSARRHLAALHEARVPAPVEAVREAAAKAARSDDVVLSHEALGHGIEVLKTAVLAQALDGAGIDFLGYLGYGAESFAGDPSSRLYVAETLDLLEGGYRHAVFGRSPP